jgi:formate hydrogenlyase subunit 4
LFVPHLLDSFSLAHDAVPCIRRERDTLSHRVDARDGPVMETSMLIHIPKLLVKTAHFTNKSQKIFDTAPKPVTSAF